MITTRISIAVSDTDAANGNVLSALVEGQSPLCIETGADGALTISAQCAEQRPSDADLLGGSERDEPASDEVSAEKVPSDAEDEDDAAELQSVQHGQARTSEEDTGKIDRVGFYVRFRGLFHKRLNQSQVDGYNAIFARWESDETLTDVRWLAYILATAYHETGRLMEPVREGFAKTDQGAVNAVTRLYKKGRISRNYALADPPGSDKHYFGRGLVQLTHRSNYERLGRVLGIDLVNNPDLALDLKTSVDILFIGMIDGLYTGKKLAHYFDAERAQWGNARRIVNGLDKSALIAGHGRKFYEALTGTPI
ncbi:MAG: glycoside hydrolase family 19 protein [Pseudomonadota bacterium]